MKKQKIQIDIPQPCDQPWNNMTPNADGRFCQQCEKTVVDFSNKTDREIAMIVKSNNRKLCGRFQKHQLKRDISLDTRIHSQHRLKAAGLLLSGMLTAGTLHGQEALILGKMVPVEQCAKPADENQKTVHKQSATVPMQLAGVVTDEAGEALPFANVFIEEAKIGTTTDIDGKFSLKAPANARILVVSYTGYGDMSIDLTNKSEEDLLNIKVEMSAGVLMGDIVLVGVMVFKDPGNERNYYRKTLAEKAREWIANIKEKRQNKVKQKESDLKIEQITTTAEIPEIPTIPGVATYQPIKSVFPNPFENELHLSLEGEREETLQVIVSDELGRAIYKENLNVKAGSNIFTLNIENASIEYGKCFLSIFRKGEIVQTEILLRTNVY